MSGVVPQVAALMGPCAAGTAYIPGLADFVPMVKGRGSMALAGPPLVKAVTGEDVTQEELGGSQGPQPQVAAWATSRSTPTRSASRRSRTTCSYFPSHCEEAPPSRASADPVDRRDEELLDVLPESPRKPYDMYDVIRRIVDDGEWFDIKPRFAKHDHHLPGPHRRAAGRHRGQPAEAPGRDPRERLGRQGGALHQPVRRVRHPAAVPAGRARVHGRHEGRAARASSATGRRCSTRSRARPCRRSRWSCARPTAPATT